MLLRTTCLTLSMLVGGVSMARAEAPLPLGCELTFKAKGGGAQVIFGHFQLKGTGTIACVNSEGAIEKLPVKITLGGHPMALRAAVGYMEMAGIATGVGLSGSPQDLLGKYAVVGTQGVIGIGGGAQVAFHATDKSISLNAALELIRGVGFNVGLSGMKIEKAGEESKE